MLGRCAVSGFVTLLWCVLPTYSQVSGNWYRGNLHAHSTDSDGQNPAVDVATWYKSHGYDFLAVTEHNNFLPAEIAQISAALNQSGRPFLLIMGEEVSDHSADGVLMHMTAWNARSLVQPQGGVNHGDVMQKDAAAIIAAGGVPDLAHPYWGMTTAAEVVAVPGLSFLEVNNPAVCGPVDQLWDDVLSQGRKIFATGVDDEHSLMPNLWASPGRSWVVVRAPALTTDNILRSMLAGDFYASSGIALNDIQISSRAYTLSINAAAGMSYRTDFIGRGGTILSQSTSLNSTYTFNGTELYVRAKVYEFPSGALAWAQPTFPGTAPLIAVSLVPQSGMVNAGQSIQLQATVTGSTNTAVQWSMSPALGTISSSGIYAAPADIAVAQTVTITAASVADPTKFATTNISLVPAIALSQGFPPIRIHAGPAYTDPSGILWSADSNFTGGGQLVTSNNIPNTSTPALYQGVHNEVTIGVR